MASTMTAVAFIFFIFGESMLTITPMQPQLTLQSNSFKNGAPIPRTYTCDGENISPQLSWQLSNENTTKQSIKSYVLIVDDPDAQKVVGKTVVHWMALLSPETTHVPEGLSGENRAPISFDTSTIIECANGRNQNYYRGPCPPPESGIHTYRFMLFATTQSMETLKNKFLHASATGEEFKQKMDTSIIVEALLTGTYHR